MRDVVVTGANGWIGGRVGSLLEQRGLRVILTEGAGDAR